jgi:hypothetical protein
VSACTEKALVNKVDGVKAIVGASFQCFSLPPSRDVTPIGKVSRRMTEVIKGGVRTQVEDEHARAKICKMPLHFAIAFILLSSPRLTLLLKFE